MQEKIGDAIHQHQEGGKTHQYTKTQVANYYSNPSMAEAETENTSVKEEAIGHFVFPEKYTMQK